MQKTQDSKNHESLGTRPVHPPLPPLRWPRRTACRPNSRPSNHAGIVRTAEEDKSTGNTTILDFACVFNTAVRAATIAGEITIAIAADGSVRLIFLFAESTRFLNRAADLALP